MPPLPHYARTVPYARLEAELEAARADRLVYCKDDGPLRLWCYTPRTVYERLWSPAVLAARGLVLDRARRLVVATAFPKFFNVGERDLVVPDEPCEVFEKVDGSLIVIFHDGRRWRAATKGALGSSQAQWAERRLAGTDLSTLTVGTTYLAEAIYAENRIIVAYPEEGLVLLGAYRDDGMELSTAELEDTVVRLGWRMAERTGFASLDDAVAHAASLPPSAEGYVIRFAGGLRLKAKGAAYCRIHALVARVTPLGLWEAMVAGEDLDRMRRDIPEEFWGDFDRIRQLLDGELEKRVAAVAQVGASVAALTDKELGLRLSTLPDSVRRHIFAWRQNPDLLADRRARAALLRDAKPRANALDGYAASYAVQRVADDG